MGEVHGFPSLEEFLESNGWRLYNSKRRLWTHSSMGTHEEEDAIKAAYQQIEDRASIGISWEDWRALQREAAGE